MVDAIDSFTGMYARTVIEYLRGLPDPAIERAADLFTTAIPREGNTVYLFGNGGTHAIARHMARSLRARFAGVCGMRVNCGVDFHDNQSTAVRYGYESVFEAVLEAERASERDLVVLLSGSGDSDNLLLAARHCRLHGIPTVSFAGFDGGRITRRRMTDHPIVVGVHDQQMSEDVMQVLLHVLVETAYRDLLEGGGHLGRCLADYTSKIERALRRLDAAVLHRISGHVCDAFVSGRGVYLLAPEGGALSLSAEHTAHNFNWDAIFEVRRPPKRVLHSTPTSCDYSGIANDRLMPGVVSCQQLDRAAPGDVLLLYAADLGSEAARNTLAAAEAAEMRIMALAGHASGLETPDLIVYGTRDQDVLGDVTQMTGHILGRLIRLKLKRSVDAVDAGDVEDDGADPFSNLATYLVDGDLAQRRLIDVVAGV